MKAYMENQSSFVHPLMMHTLARKFLLSNQKCRRK